MARPPKIGLDYFPFEVVLPEDEKMKFVRARFGLKGYAIYTLLLCKIYRDKGYYCRWGSDEALLFANDVGDGVTITLVNDVVQELFKRELLNKCIFETFKILTSKGIQERYQYICKVLKRPFEINEGYDCRVLTELKKQLSPEKEELSPPITQTIPDETTQKKGKEIKEKEREWRTRTVESEAWIDEAAIHTGKSKPQVISFCENFIKTKVLGGALEIYGPQALTGFMLTDLQKAKVKNGGNGKTGADGYGTLEVGDIG